MKLSKHGPQPPLEKTVLSRGITETMAIDAGKMLGIKGCLPRPGNCKVKGINLSSKGGIMPRSIKIAVCLGLILALATICQARERRDLPGPWAGQVLSVRDGDTYKIQAPWGTEVVRPKCFDTPELVDKKGRWLEQPGAVEAAAFARDLLEGKQVWVEPLTFGYFHRPLVNILLADGRRLAVVMIEAGHAWYGCSKFKALQAQAKAARRGLWADPNPLPPYKWRRGEAKK